MMRLERTLASRFTLNRITATLLFGSAFAAFGTSQAVAQPSSQNASAVTAPTVTVTGTTQERSLSSPKATSTLLDTPQTITVIPESVYRAQGAQNLTDVLNNTPGISFNAGENGFGTNTNNFSMRGFDSSGNVFIDGVRDSGNYSRDIFNVEQVEVIKGPAADNGRGGAGGYVNQVTKSPKLKDEYSTTFSYGFDEYDSDERLRAALDLNKQFTGGSAGRLNLLLQDGGIAGREEVEKRSIGVAPSIAFGLDTDTRFVASYQYLKLEDRPDWGVPAALIEDMMRFDPNTRESDRDRFYGLRSDYDDTDAHALLGRIEHSFSSDLVLSNQTRWSKTERDARYTVPTGYAAETQTVATQVQFYARENTNVSNITNLAYAFQTGSLKHRLSAGFEISREESESGRFATPDGGPTSLTNPDPNRTEAPAAAPTQVGEVEVDTFALYVYDTIELNDRWQITGGLRGERYEVQLASRNIDGTPQSSLDGYDVSETTVSGKLGLVFKPADNGNIYAAVGLSSLPPGSFLSNPDISRTGDNAFPGATGQNNADSDVQRAINYEIGTKWELFDKRLSTSAALFRTDRRKVAITGKTPGEPDSPTVLQGYGEQIVQGIELSATGNITPAWTIFGGIGYLDSERQHSAYLDAARREANPGDYGTYLSTDGDELAFTPSLTANLWTTYRLTPKLTVGGGVRHVDESYAGRPDDADRIIPNGQFGKLPDYTVVNAMATYAVTPKVTVRANINNLTDEVYATSANWPAQRVFLGDPRSFLLSADIRF